MISRLAAAGKFVSRIKTRGRMSIRLRGRFLKILFLGEAKKTFNEAIARKAHEKAPWCHMDAITNDILLATRYCGIMTARLASGSRPSLGQSVDICRDVMDHIPHECEWKSVFDVVDGRVADILDRRIEPGLKAHVYDLFQDTVLPVTGAHGDMGCRNVLIDNDGSYKVIDWECFRQDGSCIEDLCRLLGTAVRSSSDAGSDVRELQECRIMDVIAERSFLTHDQCVVLYALSQASCELEKKGEIEVAKRLSQRVGQATAAVLEAPSPPSHTKDLAAL